MREEKECCIFVVWLVLCVCGVMCNVVFFCSFLCGRVGVTMAMDAVCTFAFVCIYKTKVSVSELMYN
jgi:hypothetical protein